MFVNTKLLLIILIPILILVTSIFVYTVFDYYTPTPNTVEFVNDTVNDTLEFDLDACTFVAYPQSREKYTGLITRDYPNVPIIPRYVHTEEYNEQMRYVELEVGFAVGLRQPAIGLYFEHDGDLDLMIEHFKQQETYHSNLSYIWKEVGSSHSDVESIFKSVSGDVEKTIEIFNDLEKKQCLPHQLINYIMNSTDSNLKIANNAFYFSDGDVNEAILFVNQAFNATNGNHDKMNLYVNGGFYHNQKIGFIVDDTNSDYALAHTALTLTNDDMREAILLVNQVLNTTNGNIVKANDLLNNMRMTMYD